MKPFIKGMDVSSLKELEQLGAEYYKDGEKRELLGLLKEYGTNAVRLRLWNDPYSESGVPYGAGTNDLKTWDWTSFLICITAISGRIPANSASRKHGAAWMCLSWNRRFMTLPDRRLWN